MAWCMNSIYNISNINNKQPCSSSSFPLSLLPPDHHLSLQQPQSNFKNNHWFINQMNSVGGKLKLKIQKFLSKFLRRRLLVNNLTIVSLYCSFDLTCFLCGEEIAISHRLIMANITTSISVQFVYANLMQPVRVSQNGSRQPEFDSISNPVSSTTDFTICDFSLRA